MHDLFLSVDCDITVCPSDIGWKQWLEGFYGPCEEEMVEYNFSYYYPEVEGVMDYWRELDYSQFQPLKGSVEVLRELSKDVSIVFTSTHKGNHSKSKYYWLKEHFPFIEGVFLTKEKYLLNNSVLCHVDDRLDALEGFEKHKRILFSSPYTQTSLCSVEAVIEEWDEKAYQVLKSIVDFENEWGGSV